MGNDGDVDIVGSVVVDGLPRRASWNVQRLSTWRDPVEARTSETTELGSRVTEALRV